MAGRAPSIPQKSKTEPVPHVGQASGPVVNESGSSSHRQAGKPVPLQTDGQSIPHEEWIRSRAYEIYLESGGQDGSDLDHWLQAEAEFRTAQGKEV
jgi:hypothetical protein